MATGKEYAGRPVTKEVLAFGVAGQLDRPVSLGDPCRVKFEVIGDLRTFSHKVEKDGNVTEQATITIDPDTFAVLEKWPLPEPQPELPLQEDLEGAGDGEGEPPAPPKRGGRRKAGGTVTPLRRGRSRKK